MRWQALFADLEAQADAADRAELQAEVRDRSRREGALVTAVERLRASRGSAVAVAVHGGGTCRGTLLDVGRDWLLVEEPGPRDVLVPMGAVLGVTGVSRQTQASAGQVEERLDLRWALRRLARDRTPLRVGLRDAGVLTGTLDRVGADHVDLAEHGQGELRRAGQVRAVRLVPLDALAVLRQV